MSNPAMLVSRRSILQMTVSGSWHPPDQISGVNVFRCPNGVNCHAQDFQSDQAVSSNSVGTDAGPFYVPFIVDPSSSSTLLVGTCRVWRGPSTGGTYSLLSPNFEIGGNSACNGNETNMVRALSAGGPADSSGNSQVVYAGTDGDGPLIPTSPLGGRVWVTTNSDIGISTWVDRTGTINPKAFPISSIAIDPADTSGQTAYVAVMGFHTSHVWKTSNAGVSWTDFTGSLPDAPANSLVIDAGSSTSNGTLYVGTDVGVFATSTGAPSWNEVGPPSSQPGFLPNVAVTALKLFDFGGDKRLRASTYGRGIWEWDLVTTPDFQICIASSSQTVYAGQTATYNGTIQERNGYSSAVNLSCAAGSTKAPQTCSANPASVTPTALGTSFNVNAGDVVGDYSFNLQATGTDPASISHSIPLVLHVVDFTLGVPSPTTITLSPGATSGAISLTVSAAGEFSGSVNLSCSGLPAGVTCQFLPSTASPSSGNAIAVVLTISAASNASAGMSQITISASSPGASTKTQTLSLNIAAAPDYHLAVSNASLLAQVNATAVFNGTITGMNGYTNSVALSCGSGAPPTCTITPTSVVPSSSGVAFSVSVSSAVAQTYPFSINAVGSDPAATARSVPLTFTSLPNQSFDFSLSATPTTVSVSRGSSALYALAVAPNTGTFPIPVTFLCSGLPALTACSFNPAQVASGSGQASLTLGISTTAPSASQMLGLFLWLPLAVLLPGARKRQLKCTWLLIALFSLALTLAGCGNGLHGNGTAGGSSANPGTKPGSYSITITATSGMVSHSTPVTLTVNP